MRKTAIIFVLLPVFMCSSCTEKSRPTGSSGPLFSVTVVDADGNPAEGLRVGSINHPIGGFIADGFFPKPCPNTPIQFSLPEAGSYTLTITNYNGAVIKTFSDSAEAGTVQIIWDGTDENGDPIPSGFYNYRLVAGAFEDGHWVVFEKGPSPQLTTIGALDSEGQFTTDDTALFPGLIGLQPIEFYTDTVTIHLSRPEFPDDFYYHVVRLSRRGNRFSFVLDSLGLPE